MFGITRLKKEVRDQKNEIKKLNWLYLNPPQYKVGDKIGKTIVTHVELITERNELCWRGDFDFYFDVSGFSWKYHTLDKNEKPLIKIK